MESKPPLNPKEVEQELMNLIAERLLEAPASFGSTSDLFEMGLDSMGIMQLLLLIDEKFGLWLEPSDLTRQHFCNVQAIAQLVRDRLSKPPTHE